MASVWKRAFQFGGGHAVDRLARGGLVERGAGIDDPVRQAIAAKPGQPHQVYVLRIVALAQVPAGGNGGGGLGVCEFVDRIGGSSSWCSSLVFDPGFAIARGESG